MAGWGGGRQAGRQRRPEVAAGGRGAAEPGETGGRGAPRPVEAMLPSAGRAGQERWRERASQRPEEDGARGWKGRAGGPEAEGAQEPARPRRPFSTLDRRRGPGAAGRNFSSPRPPWSAPGWGLLAVSPGLSKEAALGNAAPGSGDRSARRLPGDPLSEARRASFPGLNGGASALSPPSLNPGKHLD